MNFIANIDCEYVMRLFSLFFLVVIKGKSIGRQWYAVFRVSTVTK